MLSAHERFLARRYLWPGAGGRFILLVAAIGCAGIAIGVASLILVVSFMNGADARLSGQIAAIDGHLAVTRARHALPDWRHLAARAARVPGVVRAAPVLEQSGLVSVDGRVQPAVLQGMRTADIARLPAFQRGGVLVIGHLPHTAGQVALGTGLAARLGVTLGDPVSVLSVQADPAGGLQVGTSPLRVAGIYETGVASYDDARMILPIGDVQAIFARGDVASRIDVNAATEARSLTLTAALRAALGGGVVIHHWRELNRTMFDALAQERIGMAAAVSLVTIVALANILSSLVLLVRFKVREIAVLRTMGATTGSIMRIFVTVGLAIGVAGEAAGVAIGLTLKAAKDPAAAMARQWTGPSAEMDIFLAMPMALSGAELGGILAAVTGGILLATILPARSAAAIDPARALRYD